MLLSVVDGNTSEEFNRSDFDYKWYLHAKKSIFSPRFGRTESRPGGLGGRRHKVGAVSEVTKLCQWSST